MAKIRGIKPETWTDDRLVSVSPLARLLFIGMWNFACDNGHLDDSPLQLKMRILPADDCDIDALLGELLACGLVIRGEGFLKVPTLPEHQKLDRRFLVFCDHCVHDEKCAYSPGDKAPRTTSARRAHVEQADTSHVRTTGARGDGDGDGDGDLTTPNGVVARKSARGTRIPDPFLVTGEMRSWAATRVPGVTVDAATEKFVNYWRARTGRDATKLDWPATWRNWLINDFERLPMVRGKPTRSQENLAVVAQYAAMEQIGIEG